MTQTLNEQEILVACQKLAAQDEILAFILKTYGAPPLWERARGFATLVHIILEQQVSIASAKACFDKLENALGAVTPENFRKLTDEELKFLGFSRQKALYCRNLAEAVLSKQIDLEALENLSDDDVKTELKKLKGIGDWSSDIYLLMAMLRTDVMPKGDLALHVAWQKLTNAENRPNSDDFIKLAEKWKPWRAVAARLLWHFYLSERKK